VYMIGDDGTVYEDDVLKGPASELQMSLMKIAAQKIVLKVFKTDPENKEFKKRDSIETIEVLEFMEQMDINEQQNLAQILKSKYEEKPNFEINVNNSFKQLKTDYGNNLPGIDICAFKQKIVFCTADNERIEMEFSTGVRQDGISFEAQGCNILSAKAMQIFGTDVTIKPTAEASAYIKISMDGDISTVINGNLSLHAETGEDFTSDLSVGIRLESSLTKIDITSSSNVTSTTPQRGYNIGSGLNKTIKQAQGTSTTVLGLSELTEKIGANTYYERYVYKVCPTKGSVEGEGEQVIVPIDKTLKEIESMIELEMINYFSNLSVNSG